MNRILPGIKEIGLYKKDSFPYRRGCIEPHEKLIGPCKNWFDKNKDYIL